MERVKELLKSYNLDEEQVEQLNETIVHVIDESITNVLSCVMPLVPKDKTTTTGVAAGDKNKEGAEEVEVMENTRVVTKTKQLPSIDVSLGNDSNDNDDNKNFNVFNNNNDNNNDNNDISSITNNDNDDSYYNDEYFNEKYKNIDKKNNNHDKNNINIKNNINVDQNKISNCQADNDDVTNIVTNEKLEAVKFLHRNQSHFKNELQKRHDSYKDYLRYVSELEFYCDCLAEKPKYKEKFRNNNIRFSSEEEEVLSKIESDEIQRKIDLYQTKRDTFRKRIRTGDKRVYKFIMGMINDRQVVEAAHLLYIEMCRTDEQIVNEKWVERIESAPKPSNKLRYRTKLKCFDNVSRIIKTANNYYEEPTNEERDINGPTNEVWDCDEGSGAVVKYKQKHYKISNSKKNDVKAA